MTGVPSAGIAQRWRRAVDILASGAGSSLLERLPFGRDDATAGTETELHAIVVGDRERVDLSQTIEASSYYANLVKRSVAQDTPRRALRDLERFLKNQDCVWDHSWVRLPRRVLHSFALSVFEHDLQADKSDPSAGRRGDCGRFVIHDEFGSQQVRVPVSYLLKLALADVLGSSSALPDEVAATGRQMMKHFLNDHVSPETFSFYVVPLSREEGLGRPLARETSLRHLLAQLLVMYANARFELKRNGQEAIICFSPHVPMRQKDLAESVSDSFYRELFTSPCLSGWDRGEAKEEYMHLCHQVLSRSQVQAMAKVRDAGLIASNLVLLPSLSNASLANNGVHLSLGSRRLGGLVSDPLSGFGPAEERLVGDLVIKIVEHFLPVLVGTYSAAPYRFGFADFHPERILGFLPHELDFTHLRMLWRRWKKKADLRFFGVTITPTGYRWLDRLLSFTFRLKGDFVPDIRLLDYLVAPLSTHQCPGLDGVMGSQDRLKRDLAQQGIYDARMALYMPYRLREFARMGYSGFEGRIYSLFERLSEDLSGAADVQNLVTALAYKYVLDGRLTHADIPDDPSTESERRQILFGSAIGIPTFYVRARTENRLLRRIVERASKTRLSHRYPGYVRVYHREYRLALVNILRCDAAEIIEMLGLNETLADLHQRIEDPAHCSAAGRLTRGVLDQLNIRNPMDVPAAEFNRAAEHYYRETLRRQHLVEAFDLLIDELSAKQTVSPSLQRMIATHGAVDGDLAGFVRKVRAEVLADRISLGSLQALIQVMLGSVHASAKRAQAVLSEECRGEEPSASIR